MEDIGSPPPTRGTQERCVFFKVRFGITPAYAGNTNMREKNNNTIEDHPRLRGEHMFPPIRFLAREGSPPPTRGTLVPYIAYFSSQGITPAYAGNTW